MKKTYKLSIIVLLVAGSLLAIYFIMNADSIKSEEEINKMFACDRVTTDVRATDIYCDNPDLYREHEINNTIVGK
jgi:hypothetical protein